MAPPITGSPQTALRQIGALRDMVGVGRIEIVVIGGAARFPHDTVLSSLKLMGETLVPALHEDTFTLS
jgi:hypothetical protein